MTSANVPQKRRVRALAFGGGAFDTVMQLGVTHALLVSRGKAPDYVVGISAGAVNAVALAEVLQEGSGSAKDRESLRVRRLRKILDAYLNLPEELLDSTVPDAFEVNAKKPLQPIELPIHQPEERKSRMDASRSKAGLIKLFNELLSVRLTVASATRIIRRFLAMKQAPELRRPILFEAVIWNSAGLWLDTLTCFSACSQLAWSIVYAAFTGGHGTIRRGVGDFLFSVAERLRWKWVDRLAGTIRKSSSSTAAKIIYQSALGQVIGNGLRNTVAFTFLMLLWILPVLLFAPSPGVVKTLNRWVRVGPVEKVTAGEIREPLGDLTTAVVAIPATTPRRLFDNLIDVVYAAFPVANVIGRGMTHYVLTYRAALITVLVPFLVALLLEAFWNAKAGAIFLASVAILIAFTSLQRLIIVSLLVLIIALVVRNTLVWRRNILEHYEVGDGLLSVDALQAQFVKSFNRRYFGSSSLNQIIDAALDRASQSIVGVDHPKTLDQYSAVSAYPPIHVGPVAANLRTGDLEVIDGKNKVVDALVAATAVVPLFPPKELGAPQPTSETFIQRLAGLTRRLIARESARARPRSWYIDGLNISNEPVEPLLKYLRKSYDERNSDFGDVATVDVYPVSDLPVDQSRLEARGEYSSLVDVGLRALELKKFRDATMERRLTRLYTKALKRGTAFQRITNRMGTQRTYIHAGIFPIELTKPARVNRRLARGTNIDEFKKILRETVADGCRASLQAMIPRSIRDAIKEPAESWIDRIRTSPRLAKRIKQHEDFPKNLIDAQGAARVAPDGKIELRIALSAGRPAYALLLVDEEDLLELRRIVFPRCMDVVRKHIGQDACLTGSDGRSGPGIAEICRSCTLYRPETVRKGPAEAVAATGGRVLALAEEQTQRLELLADRLTWPQWPTEGQEEDLAGREPDIREAYASYTWPTAAPGMVDWPRRGYAQPIISLLFGGGVFRGVYHVGVSNALSESGLQPDLVAGSSVGSIIAAMIASVFQAPGLDDRRRRIREVAGTFLAIDRLILTDRLADFVRRFTLRAAEAEFSPRDLDRVLRRFDSDRSALFNLRARKVAAGLERLFYFSPFELLKVVEAIRLQRYDTAAEELLRDLQEFLSRCGLSDEILGSEPLSKLIELHVTQPMNTRHALFSTFLSSRTPIFFLATTTNLVQGKLEIIGAPWYALDASLDQGLLASSAFPAVFRPRQAWEVFSTTTHDEKFIDGGTIDNLPLDAVARFLDEATEKGKIQRRPDVPHLLFTASLEIDRKILPVDDDRLGKERKDFLGLMARAGTFKYNRKLDSYANVQQRLRDIHDELRLWEPLNLHVIAVKPTWLCNTFGFHPMLGFRRRKQAQSIAHGCATTFATLHESQSLHPQWWKGWTDVADQFDDNTLEKKPGFPSLTPQKAERNRDEGHCWFRTGGALCPFSEAELKKARPELSQVQVREINEIYRLCGEAETHRAGN